AQALKVTFSREEDSPDQAIAQMSAQARQRIDFLVRDAIEVANSGRRLPTTKDPSYKPIGPAHATPLQRYKAAQDELLEARTLAVAFGQDLMPIDSKIQWVLDLRNLAVNAERVVQTGGVKPEGDPQMSLPRDPQSQLPPFLPPVAQLPPNSPQSRGQQLL